MLDEKELQILCQLRKDSRQSLAEISKKTNIPVSTVFDKLRKLEGILITKHTSFIDLSRIGYNIKAVFFVKSDKKEEFRNFSVNHKSINTISRINNNYDYLIEAIFRNMGELYGFIEEMENFNVKKMSHHYIEEDVKREGMFSDITKGFP